ncbi:hypothetical protein RJ639_038953 [Escallonia herrerae]|uniref:Alpha/beta hydrolase fold-3 domain-containing protein n=1 Tax=Escallonia herrerae TaxID=1293975 RepID=A0AA88WXA9_9ASTE|nr:hypothetical protein RJ639_038953 [Escallonia herrerae]
MDGIILYKNFKRPSNEQRSKLTLATPAAKSRLFWRLSIPVGETPDHPLANPFGPTSTTVEPVKLDPILVIAGGSELMKGRVEDYARRLRELGKEIEYYELKERNMVSSQMSPTQMCQIKYCNS